MEKMEKIGFVGSSEKIQHFSFSTASFFYSLMPVRQKERNG